MEIFITMKKLLILLFMFAITANAQLKPDKYYHAGVGTSIAIASHLILKGDYVNPYKGTLIVAPIAFGKESFDSMNGGRFDFVDIGASLLVPILIDTGVLIFKSIKNRRRKVKSDPFDEFQLVAK